MTKKIKVLAITNMFPDSSNIQKGVFVKDQLVHMSRNHNVEYSVLYINGNNKLNYLKAWFEVLKLNFKAPKYDLVHSHYGLSGIIASFQFRIPNIISFCGSDLLMLQSKVYKSLSLFNLLIVNLMVKIGILVSNRASGIIVKSEQMNKILDFRAKVIPSGVNTSFFIPLDVKISRRALNLDLEKKYVLFLSNPISQNKNYPLAQESVRKLSINYKNVVLLPVHNRSRFEVLLYLNSCDVLILTSDYEGSPNVVKEALSCNVPVVSVDVGDVSNIIKDVKNTHLCEHDSDSISEGLNRVIEKGGKSTGRDKIISLGIDQDTICDRILDLYKNTLISV